MNRSRHWSLTSESAGSSNVRTFQRRAEVEPWLTEQLIAAHFGVSLRTVRRWRAAGCPSRKMGAARRYRLSEVDAWLRSRG